MAPPGAPDRHGQIALALAYVLRDEKGQEIDDATVELEVLRNRLQVGPDFGVQPALAPEPLHEERVRQEARVEQQVGLRRQAVLVTEGDDRDVHRLVTGLRREVVLDVTPQLVHVEVAAVDDEVSALTERLEGLTFAADPFLERSPRRQRVRAAGLREAADQGVIVRLEEDEADPAALGAAQGVEHRGKFLQKRALADVHDQRGARDVGPAGAQVGEHGDERHGKVVDAKVPQVFEGPDRQGLPRPRKTRDRHDLEGALHPRIAGAHPFLPRASWIRPASSLAAWYPLRLRR